MNTWEDFLSELTLVGSMRYAKDEAIRDWGDDIPVTLLFACLGRGIAHRFDELSQEEKTFIFSAIEKAMNAADVDLRTVVATGLLEALSSKIHEDAGLTRRVSEQLGEASLSYLDKWNRWGRS